MTRLFPNLQKNLLQNVIGLGLFMNDAVDDGLERLSIAPVELI